MPPHPIPPRAGGADSRGLRSPSLPGDGKHRESRHEPPEARHEAAPAEEGDAIPDTVKEEIRTRDQAQLELFLKLTGSGALALWLVLTAFVYSHSFGRSPILGFLFAPLLAALGAAIATLPLAIACGVGVLVLYPRHRKAGVLERYEASHPRTRPCDVCVLARGDRSPRPGVAYCARCDAWLCPQCRGRYDLRAIAALRATRARGAPPSGPATPSAPTD
jgi:hypothetical protein